MRSAWPQATADADQEREQHEIADRVGEPGRDDRRSGRACGAARCRRSTAAETEATPSAPIRPSSQSAGGYVSQPRAGQPRERRRRRAGRTRARRRPRATGSARCWRAEDDVPVELAERPERERERHQRPGGAVGPARRRAQRAEQRRADDDPVVEHGRRRLQRASGEACREQDRFRHERGPEQRHRRDRDGAESRWRGLRRHCVLWRRIPARRTAAAGGASGPRGPDRRRSPGCGRAARYAFFGSVAVNL